MKQYSEDQVKDIIGLVIEGMEGDLFKTIKGDPQRRADAIVLLDNLDLFQKQLNIKLQFWINKDG